MILIKKRALLNLAMKRFLKALRLCQKSGKIIAPFSNALKKLCLSLGMGDFHSLTQTQVLWIAAID